MIGKGGFKFLGQRGEEWWQENEGREETIVWLQRRVGFCPKLKKKCKNIRAKKENKEWDPVGK